MSPAPAAAEADTTCRGFSIVTDPHDANPIGTQTTLMNSIVYLSTDANPLVCDSATRGASLCESDGDGGLYCPYTCYDMASPAGDFIADGQVDVNDLSLYNRMFFGGMQPGAPGRYLMKDQASPMHAGIRAQCGEGSRRRELETSRGWDEYGRGPQPWNHQAGPSSGQMWHVNCELWNPAEKSCMADCATTEQTPNGDYDMDACLFSMVPTFLREANGGAWYKVETPPTWTKVNLLFEKDIAKCPESMFDPNDVCLLYTSPSPRDRTRSRMPSSA